MCNPVTIADNQVRLGLESFHRSNQVRKFSERKQSWHIRERSFAYRLSDLNSLAGFSVEHDYRSIKFGIGIIVSDINARYRTNVSKFIVTNCEKCKPSLYLNCISLTDVPFMV